MAGKDNLKPIQSTSEARKRGAAGGKKSGVVRREKKRLREAMEVLLKKKDSDGVDGYTKAVFSLYATALGGDAAGVSAFNAIRDLIGEKPTDKVEVGADNTKITSISIEIADGNINEYDDGQTIIGDEVPDADVE